MPMIRCGFASAKRRCTRGRESRFACLEWLTSLPLQHGEPVRIRLHFVVRAPVAGASRVLTYQMDHQATHRDLARPGRYWVDLIAHPWILGPDIYDVDISCRSGGFHVVQFNTRLHSSGGDCRTRDASLDCPRISRRAAGRRLVLGSSHILS